ncbi:hypothetical protein COY27_07175 [Candidatus Woesearchaeota archaeon CG_4_10_14_0_2_um_filter_33_13]|nr:MAG: hypothetical protein COY27_07175 [Candidatus Woesearchaeota archaeon CG_4_10_14_0_2_um_filter_33_13]
MNTTTKIAIGGTAVLAIVILSAWVAKQAKALYDACFTVAGAVIHTISIDKMDMDLLINIANKSDVSFTLTNQNYQVYINKMLVATVNNKENTTVVSQGNTTMKINIKFNPQDLLKKGIENIANLIKNKDSLVVEIRGSISIGKGLVSFNDYRVDETLLMKELLSTPKNSKC